MLFILVLNNYLCISTYSFFFFKEEPGRSNIMHTCLLLSSHPFCTLRCIYLARSYVRWVQGHEGHTAFLRQDIFIQVVMCVCVCVVCARYGSHRFDEMIDCVCVGFCPTFRKIAHSPSRPEIFPFPHYVHSLWCLFPLLSPLTFIASARWPQKAREENIFQKSHLLITEAFSFFTYTSIVTPEVTWESG